MQATDQYAGTLHARIVCVDDRQARAVMTASWLRQMGWREVYVLVAAGDEKGFPANPVLGEAPKDAAIGAAALNDLLMRTDATVIDLSLSRRYQEAHIAGAWFAIRSRLSQALDKIKPGDTVVRHRKTACLQISRLRMRAHHVQPVRFLSGGNTAWHAGGFPLTDDPAWPTNRSMPAQALRAA